MDSSSSCVCDDQTLDSIEPFVFNPPRGEECDSDELCVGEASNQALDSSEPFVCAVPAAGDWSAAGASGSHESPGIASSDRQQPYTSAEYGPTRRPDASDLGEETSDQQPAAYTGSTNRRNYLLSNEVKLMWSWWRILTVLGTIDLCKQFSEERGLVATNRMCWHHRRPMYIDQSIGVFGTFRCRKGNCRIKSVSRTVGTWFENCHLPLHVTFKLLYCFARNLSYEEVKIQCYKEGDTVLSNRTISDWYSYCRETVVVYQLENQVHQGKIGGPGKIVQLNESKFGKRKYNRGRQVEGHWVLGMIEDKSDDLRVEVCPDNVRSAEVLVPLIQKHIEVGSIIYTDYWRAYDCLPQYGYQHKKVNHSDPTNKFVAPDGTHTQRIESHWRVLKSRFNKDNYKGNFSDWLIEFTWRRKISLEHLDPFEELIKCIKHVYMIE